MPACLPTYTTYTRALCRSMVSYGLQHTNHSVSACCQRTALRRPGGFPAPVVEGSLLAGPALVAAAAMKAASINELRAQRVISGPIGKQWNVEIITT